MQLEQLELTAGDGLKMPRCNLLACGCWKDDGPLSNDIAESEIPDAVSRPKILQRSGEGGAGFFRLAKACLAREGKLKGRLVTRGTSVPHKCQSIIGTCSLLLLSFFVVSCTYSFGDSDVLM